MLLLYGLRFVNPDLATDWDIFITTLGIVYSSHNSHTWMEIRSHFLFSQVLLIFYNISLFVGYLFVNAKLFDV